MAPCSFPMHWRVPNTKHGWVPPPRPERGYAQLYFDTVLQAEEGCDFAVLRGPPAGGPDEPAPGVT